MSYQFTFNPQACGDCNGICCNGETGNIWVSKKEMVAIASFIGIDVSEFIDSYLRKVGYRYSIKELKKNDNYACLFFDVEKNGCGIYDVRPEQCRTYPFWPFFKENPDVVVKECPGAAFKKESE